MKADPDSHCEPTSSQLDTLFEGKPIDKLAKIEVTEVIMTINKLGTISCELDPLSI